jgi:predicted HTH transcriptional regulator
MDAIELLKKPESKTLEFKRDLSSPEGVLRTITAFSNTSGGILIVGVEDKTKKICGVENPLLLEEKLASIISDSIVPKVVPDIEIIPYRNTYLIVVEIHPGSVRPYYLKKLGEPVGTYIRVGSTNRLADKIIISELKRFVLNESFDEQPFPKLSSEAIDFRVASELFSSICKLTPSKLETLDILTNYQGHNVPTIGGVILFCQQREKYFPDSWIQVGRFAGHNKRYISDAAEIHSYPIIAVDEVMNFVRKHSLMSLEIRSVRHQEKWNLPLAAIREAVINAVVHADYEQNGAPIRLAIFDDRIEIENPGLLKFGLTIDDIKRGVSKLRNRVIGRVFHKLGLIERWGSGIGRIIESCKEAGFDEPVFEEIGTHFRVTIFTEQKTKSRADEIDQQILKILDTSSGCSTEIIANLINRSKRATRNRMLTLINKGLVIEIGLSPKDPYKKYFLTKK